MSDIKYPWQHYNVGVYWSLPDDGATIKCNNCKNAYKCNDEMLKLIQIPSGERAVLCLHCIDEGWLSIAVNKGLFTH